MKKKRFIIIAIVFFMVILPLGIASLGNPMLYWHHHQLKAAMSVLPEGTVTLEDVVPFSWDEVFHFDPYTSKESIQTILGSASPAVKSSVSEGMTHLIFRKDGRITCSVCAYPDGVGYQIDFTANQVTDGNGNACYRIENGERIPFQVIKKDGYILLCCQETVKSQSLMRRFMYDGLELEVTGVLSDSTEIMSDDGENLWEYPVYTCVPGAQIRVIQADMLDSYADGKKHAQWAIYREREAEPYSYTESRIDIVDGMEPVNLTTDMQGIIHKEANLYVLRVAWVTK